MQSFARSMQWLFTVVGLLFLVVAGGNAIFGESGNGSSVEIVCSPSSTTNTCNGSIYGIRDRVENQTVATVGVGLLLVACVMAVTAGAARAPVPRYAVPPGGPYPSGGLPPDGQAGPAAGYPPAQYPPPPGAPR
ncbi:hypothetical protein [Cryptosporangium minutisporangium]|uniref:Uncharacterized protein n=1 Tax=Cryptosporangium minutisporangium TaxID=113569 RepID=A0ABP6T7A0_9ACTN